MEEERLRCECVELFPTGVTESSVPGRRSYRARFVRAGRIRAAGDRPGKIVIEAEALWRNVKRFERKAVFVGHAGLFHARHQRQDAVLAACAAQWHGCGLPAAESKAVVQVWREDLLKADNLLLARMPAKLYDAMFPLTIVPAPAELVRVGMVFDALHDQWDAASWVSARQDAAREAMARAAADLGSSDYRKREAATEELSRHGQKARRLLEKLAQSTDPEISTRARTLLEKVPLPTVEAPASPGDDPRGISIRALDGER